MSTNIEKLIKRVEADGIIDIRVSLDDNAGKPTGEELAGELLEILNTKDVPDPTLI